MDRDVVTAIVTVVVAFVIAEIVDQTLARRGGKLTQGLSPVANTRLRLVRRQIFATILLIGIMLALSQFDGIKRIATGILASSAVLGLVVGFAARQTLANGIAGILLAITQPIRIGDLVTFDGETGTVEDVRLTYTFIRKGDATRLIVPNEMLALSQFEGIKRVATGLLASSAVLGLVVGFAARQTLANAIAGILLAITQPIRIGDLVTFEGESGTVEDVRLTYTFIRKANDTRLVVPNELLAQSTIENHTIVDPRVRVEVDLWLPPSADAPRAVSVLGRDEDLDVEIAQVDKDGIRLTAATWATTAAERGGVAARVRASCLESLRNEGLAFTPE